MPEALCLSELRALACEGEVCGAAVVGWVLQAMEQAEEEWPQYLADIRFTDPVCTCMLDRSSLTTVASDLTAGVWSGGALCGW